MDLSSDHRISVHEDQAFFREAVLFTAGQTGLNATLIEKDYFCTVLLQYLYDQPDSPLIFRGGTCIGKVYTDFYRLSEDLDFMISTPPAASITVRRKRIAPVRACSLIGGHNPDSLKNLYCIPRYTPSIWKPHFHRPLMTRRRFFTNPKAGAQNYLILIDSRFRGNDNLRQNPPFTSSSKIKI